MRIDDARVQEQGEHFRQVKIGGPRLKRDGG
jgi:hypothetical protein